MPIFHCMPGIGVRVDALGEIVHGLECPDRRSRLGLLTEGRLFIIRWLPSA